MAETPVEVVIRARNETQAALNQIIGQMKQLEGATKATAASGAQVRGLRDAIGSISPAAGQAISRVETLAAAGAGFGSAAVAAGAVAAGIGLITAAAVKAAVALADTVEQLDNLATVTGTSVGNIQVLQELFSRAGLGAETARTALHKLNVAIGEQNPLLAKLGVTSREPIEALMQLAAAFETSKDAGLRAKVAQELLGRGGKDLLAVLDSLRETFPRLSKEMDETGQKLSPDLVKAGRELDVQFEQLAGRWEGRMNRMKEATGKFFLTVLSGGPLVLAYAIAQQKAREEAEKSTNAWERYRKSFSPVVDLLKQATTEQPKLTAAQKEHEASVQEIVKLFGKERAEAEKVVDAYEDLAQARRKEALRISHFGGVSGINQPAPFPETSPQKDREFPNILPNAETREQMLSDWRGFIDDVQSSARVLDEALSGLGSSLTSGFTQVFQGLLTHGQTFRSAMVTIFTSMVNELLAQLARLLAFKIIGALIGLPPVTMGSPGFVYPKAGPSGLTPAAPNMATGGNTYIIQALDAHDMVASLVLPGGSLRRAQDRVSIAGAY